MFKTHAGRGWATALTLCLSFGLLTFSGCSSINAETPRQEVFEEDVVEIVVDYRAQQIRVEPEKAVIYFQWHREKKDRFKPVKARWVVRGLKRGHTIHIVAKEKAPRGIFPFPDEYDDGRESYMIDSRHNSIISGEVVELPKLVKGKGYTNDEDARRFNEEDPYTVIWPYDIYVKDARGEVVLEKDPEIVVHGHP